MEKVAYKELISAVAELSGKTKSQTQDVLDEFVQFTLATTKSGQGVSVSKLGTFAPKSRGGYTGHNPKTGELVEVKKKCVLDFKPLPSVKDLSAA